MYVALYDAWYIVSSTFKTYLKAFVFALLDVFVIGYWFYSN